MIIMEKSSQREIINKVIEDITQQDNIFKVEKEVIRGGICYMLSIEWLRSYILDNKMRVVELNFDTEIKNEEDEEKMKLALAYYKQIANNFFQYIQELRGEFKEEIKAEKIASEEDWHKTFIEKCSYNKLTCNLRKNYDGDPSKNKYFMIGINMHKNNKRIAGHMTAGYVEDNQNIIFYDPNYGIYNAKDINEIKEFLESKYARDGITLTYVFIEVAINTNA